jgi:hypothetical protein
MVILRLMTLGLTKKVAQGLKEKIKTFSLKINRRDFIV